MFVCYESVEITKKLQPCNRIYYSKIFLRLNMFRAAHCSSSGIPNCICSLWFVYTCGDRPLSRLGGNINPLNAELNPICHLLALLGVHFLHVSRIRVKSLTLRLLMSYIYGAPILDVSRSHTTTHHSR